MLRTVSVGRIAYSERALPGIATVPFAVLNEMIVVGAEAGSRWAATLRGAVVAFQAEHEDEDLWSVTCVGKATPLVEGAELNLALAARVWPLDTEAAYFQIEPELLRGRRSVGAAVSQ